MSSPSQTSGHDKNSAKYRYLLALGALGVVYGDIGTSPLYAIKETFHHASKLGLSMDNVFGVLSMIFWSLMIVITFKYLVFILRADNKGEGGILALTSLITPDKKNIPKDKKRLILMGLFGTALLYGDGMITPAISVLSAVEGLSLITPVFDPYIIPITVVILLGLFSIQKKGTGTVGKIFGPVTLLWFFVLGLLGIFSIIENPEVLKAINPYYAFNFFFTNSWTSMIVLGSVFLVVTGGEALYSDLGHFGIKPIRTAWFLVVLPCLVLNYFGQGALLLRTPEAITNPFFLLAPKWALYPLVILATMSTVIASQALITGVFSLTMQAVQHGYMPRVSIDHTSDKEFGQIYVKSMNRFLMIGTMLLVFTFKSSSNLASAYGLAVTSTMVITTILFYIVAREKWGWSFFKAFPLCAFLFVIDFAFFGANLLKLLDGGYVPLGIGLAIFTYMTTWKLGRKILAKRISSKIVPLTDFLARIRNDHPTRVEGFAIYMNGNLKETPHSLIHTYDHFKVIHQKLIFLSVVIKETPTIPIENRIRISPIGDHCYTLVIHYGYMEKPNIPRELDGLVFGSEKFDKAKVTYFMGKETLFATERPGMALWREKLFAFQSINALSATTYFQMPKDRVMEIGIHVDL